VIPKGQAIIFYYYLQIAQVEENLANLIKPKRTRKPWFITFNLEKTLADCSVDVWSSKPSCVSSAQQAYFLRA
jgi:hypothetical protein